MSKELTGYLNKFEIELLHEESEKQHYRSVYNFLNSHNGWRKGCVHTILGISHGGKSTLIRSLIFDAIYSCVGKGSVGLWLSEESRKEFLGQLYLTGISPDMLREFFVLSELDINVNLASEMFSKLENFIKMYNIKILFFDNITTSFCYDNRSIKEQTLTTKFLKMLAERLNIPVVIIAHTGANVTENHQTLINMNDIRGCKTIVNISQFFYIMQTIYTGKSQFTTFKITKHRGQECENKLYNLIYDPVTRIYREDVFLQFSKFKEIWKDRNKL